MMRYTLALLTLSFSLSSLCSDHIDRMAAERQAWLAQRETDQRASDLAWAQRSAQTQAMTAVTSNEKMNAQNNIHSVNLQIQAHNCNPKK